MTEINNDLIKMYRELNQMSLIIDEDDQGLDDLSNLSDDEKLNNIDSENFKNHMDKINERLDYTEELIFKISKSEPNPELRYLHSELAISLDNEDYNKCQELSDKIKTY